MKKYSYRSIYLISFLLSLVCVSLQTCTSSNKEDINLGLIRNNFPLKSWKSPIEVKAVKLDSISIRTDSSSEFMFMGSITDDTFGQVKAHHITEIAPESISKKIPTNAKYVSAKLVLVGQYLNAKNESVDLDKEQHFDLYEVIESLPTKNLFNETVKELKPDDGLSSTPIASFVFNAKKSKKQVTVNNKNIEYYYLDKLLPEGNSIGQRLFDLRKTEKTDFASKLADFKTQFKGIAFIPSENNSLIAGFFNQKISTDFGDTLKDERSYINITYSLLENGTTTNYQYKFYFNNAGGIIYKYTQYLVDRSNSKFSKVQKTYTSYENDWVGFASKTGLSMKISLDPLREFVKNNPDVRVNHAQIKLNKVIESTPKNYVAGFIAGFSDDSNKRIWEKKIQKAIKQTITTASEFKYVYSPSSRNIFYSKTSDADYYNIDVSILTELYLNKVRNNEEDLILYPLNNTTPNRFYLDKSNIFFEVFYTETIAE